jgi:hypothetical protein
VYCLLERFLTCNLPIYSLFKKEVFEGIVVHYRKVPHQGVHVRGSGGVHVRGSGGVHVRGSGVSLH